MRRDGSYLSSSAPEAHFGLPEGLAVEGIELRWPDGLEEGFEADCVDCRLDLRRGAGKPLP